MSDWPIKEALLREPRLNRVCVLEDLDFYWESRELLAMKHMWKDGVSAQGMAEHFDRDPDEVLLALIHLAREDKIKARKRGLRGEK